ncbi:MAG: leucine-rich repeat protein [Clostridia bacterium]|nr:leucine-rich repeat protein [Clostridia bacterium]
MMNGFHKAIAVSLAVVLLITPLAASLPVLAKVEGTKTLNNADITPLYVEDAQVLLEDSGNGLMSPDWVKSLMIVEINPVFASPTQDLDGLTAVLDHYAEMGINCLWMTPPYDTTDGLGHYGNYGPHTISHLLTGTTDYAEGWARFKAFVDQAHAKNIRIILDTVTWGCAVDAPLYTEHPTWFTGRSNWGGWSYNWNNSEFREWFIQQHLFMVTEIGVDGFRCDLEPTVTGYEMFGEVRKRALATGEKIALFTECSNERTQPTYDFDEHASDDSTMWENWELFTETYNMVDCVKEGLSLGTLSQQQTGQGGTARFYSYRLSCHDSVDYHANGSLTNIGYQAILSPFIPIWFMGEEFDNPLTAGGQGGIIYRNPLDLKALNDPDKKDFYEKVKRLIRVRREYPEIFEYYPTNHRDSNICKVDVYGLETLQAYARYADGKGIIVVPNNNIHDAETPMTVVVPYEDMGLPENTLYRITDLLTGEVLREGSRSALQEFQATVPFDEVGVYLTEPVGTSLEGNNLLADLTVSSSAAVVNAADNSVRITCGDTVYFNNLTLEKDATYVYEFDLAYDGAYNATYPWLILRDGGQYINAGAYTCIRVCDNLNFDDFEANAHMMAEPGVPVSFKILMEPERVKVYINGEEVAFGDNVTGAPYPDNWVPLTAVADGKIGVTGGNPGFTYTLSKLSLTKVESDASENAETVIEAIAAISTVDAYSREKIETVRRLYDSLSTAEKAQVTNASRLTAAEAAFDSLNRLSALTSPMRITCGNTVYFGGLTLERDATYVYEFDITYDGAYNATFPWLILRDGGQYINVGAYTCIRVCDNLNFDDFEANAGMKAEAGVPVSFKILMEPERVKVYINGAEVMFGDNVTGAPYPDNWVPLTAVADGKIGVTGGNTGFTYTLSDLSLVKVGDSVELDDPAVKTVIEKIAAIGTVTAQSGAAIYAAEYAYEALTAAQQKLVTNRAVLVSARIAYDTITAVSMVNELIVAIGTVDAYSGARIRAAREAYDTLTAKQQTQVDSRTLFAAEETFETLNLLADTEESIHLIGGETMYFGGLTLERDATYVYEFDITYDGAYNATFPWLILRDGGQYINAGAYGCIRVCDNLNFDDFEANAGMTATAGQPVSFKILMEPTRVKVYINGSAVSFGSNIGVTITDGWVPLGAVTDGRIGVSGGNPGFGYTLSNISLVKVGSTTDEIAVLRVIQAIDGIGQVDYYSRDVIEMARSAYERLTPAQKSSVYNLSVLEAAEAAVVALNHTQDVYYYAPTKADRMGTNYWTAALSMTDRENGGIRYVWKGAGTDWRTGLDIPLALNGLHLTLGNITFGSTNKTFALYLADKTSEGYSGYSLSPLILIFDCNTGELKVTSQGSPTAGATILQTDALKADNLANKLVELKLTANGAGGYTASLLGQTGVITSAMLSSATGMTNRNAVYLTFCPWDWSATTQMSFDLLAVHGGERECTDAMTAAQLSAVTDVLGKIDAAYDANGQITIESAAALIAARLGYEALPSAHKVLVDVSRLTDAETVYTVVNTINSIGPVSAEKETLVYQADTQYRALSPEQRPIVGNYLVLRDALWRLYLLEQGELLIDSYTVGNTLFELYEKADGGHKLMVSGAGVIPAKKNLGEAPFYNYSAMIDEVIVGEGLTAVGYGLFNGFTALTSVSLPSTLVSIDGESFRGCTALKNIEIPYGVTTLGYGAFWGAGLESVVIPESVTSIKNYVFYRCKSLVSAEIYGSTAYKVGSKVYRATGARMFSECSALTNIVLGDVITLLNTYTFHGAALTEFTVPARVKFIYDAAFHSNTKMTKFVMEEGVTYLGWAALFGCSNLTDVTIPETITGGNIATWAFGACTSLESIELPSKLTSLKKRTFSGCTSLKSIELPAGVTTLGDRVFIGCTSLESIKLSNITAILEQTFNNCPKLTSITIPETVTSIGSLAFRLNESLKTVYIDSATIAAGLTGNAVYGNMIKWAETIAVRADIENVPNYVKNNYKTVGTVTVDGVEYVTYSK